MKTAGGCVIAGTATLVWWNSTASYPDVRLSTSCLTCYRPVRSIVTTPPHGAGGRFLPPAGQLHTNESGPHLRKRVQYNERNRYR